MENVNYKTYSIPNDFVSRFNSLITNEYHVNKSLNFDELSTLLDSEYIKTSIHKNNCNYNASLPFQKLYYYSNVNKFITSRHVVNYMFNNKSEVVNFDCVILGKPSQNNNFINNNIYFEEKPTFTNITVSDGIDIPLYNDITLIQNEHNFFTINFNVGLDYLETFHFSYNLLTYNHSDKTFNIFGKKYTNDDTYVVKNKVNPINCTHIGGSVIELDDSAEDYVIANSLKTEMIAVTTTTTFDNKFRETLYKDIKNDDYLLFNKYAEPYQKIIK